MILKTNNRLRKIRVIRASNTDGPVYGVVLPPQLMEKWFGIYVRVSESGNHIILESGALPIPLSRGEMRENSKKVGEMSI